MGALPREIVRVLRGFEDVFSERVWDWVQVLVVGAILTPGQRTVAAVLRVMGLSTERQYQNYHRVLTRANWSSREVSRRLLGMLVQVFVPADAPVVVGLDETIERRRGQGDLPRPGALKQEPLRQDQRAALDLDAGAGRDPVGRAGLGVAVLDGARPLGALQPGAWPSAQDAARVGTADDPAVASLAARS